MNESLRGARRAAAWNDRFADHPLFWAVARFAARLAPSSGFPDVASLDRLFTEAGVRFEESRPRGRGPRVGPSYDERIATGVVPTRPGSWHDLMNALVWAAFPRTKRALHARQREVVARDLDGAGPGEARARSREGDALALFDEGGAALLVGPGDAVRLGRALDERDDAALARLLAGGAVRPVLFGHALYEHLALGRGGVRASAIALVRQDDGVEVSEDELVAAADLGLAAFVARLSHPNELRSAYLEVLAPSGARPSGAAATSDSGSVR
jgi:hypothetical protein